MFKSSLKPLISVSLIASLFFNHCMMSGCWGMEVNDTGVQESHIIIDFSHVNNISLASTVRLDKLSAEREERTEKQESPYLDVIDIEEDIDGFLDNIVRFMLKVFKKTELPISFLLTLCGLGILVVNSYAVSTESESPTELLTNSTSTNSTMLNSTVEDLSPCLNDRGIKIANIVLSSISITTNILTFIWKYLLRNDQNLSEKLMTDPQGGYKTQAYHYFLKSLRIFQGPIRLCSFLSTSAMFFMDTAADVSNLFSAAVIAGNATFTNCALENYGSDSSAAPIRILSNVLSGSSAILTLLQTQIISWIQDDEDLLRKLIQEYHDKHAVTINTKIKDGAEKVRLGPKKGANVDEHEGPVTDCVIKYSKIRCRKPRGIYS